MYMTFFLFPYHRCKKEERNVQYASAWEHDGSQIIIICYMTAKVLVFCETAK